MRLLALKSSSVERQLHLAEWQYQHAQTPAQRQAWGRVWERLKEREAVYPASENISLSEAGEHAGCGTI
jgi:hypothetical protein